MEKEFKLNVKIEEKGNEFIVKVLDYLEDKYVEVGSVTHVEKSRKVLVALNMDNLINRNTMDKASLNLLTALGTCLKEYTFNCAFIEDAYAPLKGIDSQIETRLDFLAGNVDNEKFLERYHCNYNAMVLLIKCETENIMVKIGDIKYEEVQL